MGRTNQWRLERRVSVSVLVQLSTLAGLIVGSWVNLQRQLDLVSGDVKQLLAVQEKFCDKLDRVRDRTIAQEYRPRTVEQKRQRRKSPDGVRVTLAYSYAPNETTDVTDWRGLFSGGIYRFFVCAPALLFQSYGRSLR